MRRSPAERRWEREFSRDPGSYCWGRSAGGVSVLSDEGARRCADRRHPVYGHFQYYDRDGNFPDGYENSGPGHSGRLHRTADHPRRPKRDENYFGRKSADVFLHGGGYLCRGLPDVPIFGAGSGDGSGGRHAGGPEQYRVDQHGPGSGWDPEHGPSARADTLCDYGTAADRLSGVRPARRGEK